MSLDGLLLLDKPSGPTSHDLVDRVRRACGQRRVGHAGTLDPMASGLLPLVLGRATRLVRFLPASPKIYHGRLLLGQTTDTDDVTGEVVTRHDGPLPSVDDVLAAAASLVGHGSQVPPAVSARKVGGQRLYRLARKGVRVEAAPTDIEVGRFELRPTAEAGLFEFEAEVSGGTYVRALARDLGERLGCGGVLASLIRMAIGPMDLSSALRPEADGRIEGERIPEHVLPLERMPLTPPALRLNAAELSHRFALGGSVAVPDAAPGPRRVLDDAGALLGVGEVQEGILKPRVVVAPRSGVGRGSSGTSHTGSV